MGKKKTVIIYVDNSRHNSHNFNTNFVAAMAAKDIATLIKMILGVANDNGIGLGFGDAKSIASGYIDGDY